MKRKKRRKRNNKYIYIPVSSPGDYLVTILSNGRRFIVRTVVISGRYYIRVHKGLEGMISIEPLRVYPGKGIL